ncbi:MAG: hypothetical protein RL123_1545, partial [Pseudomonadota bacterium]
MTETARLGLPLLQAAQAQKHVTANEAFGVLDALVQAVVRGEGGSAPEGAVEGEAWVVGPGASGVWAGWSGDLALWRGGGWQRIPAAEGWRVWSLAAGTLIVRRGGAWVPFGSTLGVLTLEALASGAAGALGVGAASDATNGFVFRGTNALLQSAASIDLTLNRAGVGDGASLSFKTGYAADAILGTGGSGDLTLKAGPGFVEALRVGRLGGRVRMARARAGAWPDAVGRNRVLGRGWSAVGGLEGAGWRGLSWAEDLGLLCAVAASDGDGGGAVALSADGVSWTRHAAAGPESWAAVARGRGVFVALAEAGEGLRAMTSADGRLWTAR